MKQPLLILAFTLFLAMTSSVRALVDRLIAENKIMLFTKSYCPYCQRAKELFKTLKLSYADAELDKADDGSAIQDELLKMTGQRTVPNIFINGEHIGGNDAVQALHAQGGLLPKVNNETSSVHNNRSHLS